jgi:hypothetical protein
MNTSTSLPDSEKSIQPLVFVFSNISPVQSVTTALQYGCFRGFGRAFDRSITDVTVPLQPVSGKKKISLVCFGQRLGPVEYIERLRVMGKQPCKYAANYLLGLMLTFKEREFPPEMNGLDIAGIEPDPRSLFSYRQTGPLCFLYVCRTGGPLRKRKGKRARDYKGRVLNLGTVEGPWSPNWLFPAEDL